MKRKHLDVIAPPRYRFAAGTQLQTHEIGDWAGWTVFAGNPLRIEECEWSGFDGNSESAVNDIFRRLGRVDVQRYR